MIDNTFNISFISKLIQCLKIALHRILDILNVCQASIACLSSVHCRVLHLKFPAHHPAASQVLHSYDGLLMACLKRLPKSVLSDDVAMVASSSMDCFVRMVLAFPLADGDS